MNPGIFGNPESVVTEQYFHAIGNPGAQGEIKNWQQWTKPRNCKFVAIKCIGAGGAGGNGFSGSSGTARGGGGGGGSGATASAIYPASILPNELWIQVPRGGSVAGEVGGRAVVAVVQSEANVSSILQSGNGNAGSGGNGTDSAAGGAGGASTVLTNGNIALLSWSLSWFASLGQAAGAGGAHTGANGADASHQLMLTGGAGGGGTTSANFSGGSVTTGWSREVLQPQVNGGAAGSNDGEHGYSFRSGLGNGMWFFAGGAGGGSSNTNVGGNGGNGGIGCGGGGGGGGTTGGLGGAGGDGLVVIWTW